VSNRSFGRRATSQPALAQRRVEIPQQVEATASTAAPTLSYSESAPSHDHELEEWKRNRRYQIPWRQISLMASLCFGIASLVLPDSVNGPVEVLLWGLTAISFVAGISRRRQKAK
jgi:hypothetical protein